MAIKITKGNASDLSAASAITKGLYGKESVIDFV
jgi:hypothetical protein